MTQRRLSAVFLLPGLLCLFLTQCAPTTPMGIGNMGGPDPAERSARIASEATGNFFIGRRYYVEKTRFWGYVRQPRQSWDRAQLVMIREDRKRQPDRLPEGGPSGARYGFDQNFEYRLWGHFTGDEAYCPNSNQFLPVFMLTDYELLDRDPGWLFRPDDRYDPRQFTIYRR